MTVSLLGSFACLWLLFPLIYETIRDFTIYYISWAPQVTDMMVYGREIKFDMVGAILKGCIPLLLIAISFAVIGTGVQTKFLVSREKIKIKFSHLNPINGIKNMFSLRNLVELLKNIIKITILAIILYQLVIGELNTIAKTIDMDLKISTAYFLRAAVMMVFKVAMVFTAIAGFDIFYQRWQYTKDLMMTKQEVKEEFKQTEGNPEIKGRIRKLQRERAMSRMMQAVPQADVIIRNPTHYAVALKYDLEKDFAPILVAKGQDELALRIVKIGEENGVYVLENKPLARGIYASTQLGREIPQEYYGMVAEILVYVYKLNNKALN